VRAGGTHNDGLKGNTPMSSDATRRHPPAGDFIFGAAPRAKTRTNTRPHLHAILTEEL
jgi:hypothetical protein